MAKTPEQLLSLSSIIANETKAGANTALRVGGLFSDIIYYLRDLDYADKDDIPSLDGYATEQWVLGKGYATTTDLDARIDALVNGAPQAYDTLKEIADVLAGNVNSISDILTALGNKADKATTLSGYGITDAYTISQIDSIVNGLSGNISTLQGYFTDGVAKSALKLSDNGSYTAWGQTFFTNGKPKSVSGALTDVTDITSSGTITTNKIVIGNGTIEWDEANKGFKVTGLYSTTYLSAKGANTNGGSTPSGNQYTRLDTWDGYTSAMDGWVLSAKLGKGLYDTQNSLISRVGALEGKATNVSFTQSLTSGTQIGSISIDGVTKNIYAPTIPTSDINKGVTAYGWGNHASAGYAMASALGNYLPLSGGTLTNTLTIQRSPSVICFTSSSGSLLGYLGFGGDNTPIMYENDGATRNILIHSGNYTDYTYSKTSIDSKLGGYLPLSGGAISSSSYGALVIERKNTNGFSSIQYSNSVDGTLGHIGIGGSGSDFPYSPILINNDGTFEFIHSGNIGGQSVANTTTIRGWDINIYNGKPFGGIPIVANSGVMSVGRYIDLYYANDMSKYAARIQCQNTEYIDITLPSLSGTLARLTDNVASATKLQTARSIWGQSFDGTSDISGGLNGANFILSNMTNGYYVGNRTDGAGATDGGLLLYTYGYTPISFYTNYAEYMRISPDGNVGIGTTSPQYKLDVNGVIHSTTGIFSDGYVSAKGQNTSSDMRLKNVLNEVVLGVKDIANAPSVRFAWKNGGGVDVGSSAQYWQRVLPDAVKERDGMLEMQYANIALLSAIALAKRSETHEERIARLERENEELRTKIDMMERGIA